MSSRYMGILLSGKCYPCTQGEGVVKSPIFSVAAGSPNARRTSCTPPLGPHHCALYSKLLYVAIFPARLRFYESINVGTRKIRCGAVVDKESDGSDIRIIENEEYLAISA
jgi:hypothetical protein